MKKNFFKKLSFVMASAMLITAIAPAAGANAATSPALNSTKKVLHLSGISGKSEYDFNVKNKQSGWKYAWTSADKNVAEVDNVGLTTATGVGTTKVSVKITKSGKTYKTLSATVTVRDNIDEIEVKNAPEKELKVNEAYNLDVKYTTESGSNTKKTGSIKWTVDKADKATVAANGVFKATEAGDYKVTVSAYETSTSTEVLASNDVTIKVAPSILSTKQVDATKFTVTFDSDMSKTDIKTASVVYQVIAGKKVSTGSEKIKSVTLDTTGKIATVELYAAFATKAAYSFEYKELVGSFTSASATLADVAGIVFDDFNVDVETGTGTLMTEKVSAVNSEGVVILSGKEFANNLEFTYGGDLTKGFTNSNRAYIYTQGYTATVTAKFTNYVYNETTKKYDTVSFSDTAVATGTKADKNVNAATIQYVVNKTAGNPDANSSAWTTGISVPAGDGAFTIHARYKTNNDADNYVYTNDFSTFTYSSSNADKLLINGNTMVPLSQGNVTVIVKKGDAVIGTFDVAILAARSFAGLTQDVNSVTVGNNATYYETGKITIVAKDSLNEVLFPYVAAGDITLVNKPSGAGNTEVLVTPSVNGTAGDNYGKITLDVTAPNATPGAYYFKVVVHEDANRNATKEAYFTVMVLKANTNDTDDATSWAVDLGSASVDLKNNTGTNLTVKVYGYNAAGARVAQLNDSQYVINVKLNGNDVTSHVVDGATTAVNGTTIGVVALSGAAGSKLDFYATGTYVVTAKVDIVAPATTSPTGRVDDAIIGYAQFSVTDSTTKVVNVKTTAVKASEFDTVAEAVNAAFEFKLNGDVVNTNFTYKVSDGLSAVDVVAGTTEVKAGTNLYVDSITYTVTNTGSVTEYTIDVKKTIAIQ